jgi:hypothetical protein
LVIFKIPEKISIQNVEETLVVQNPNLNLKAEDMNDKSNYETKNVLKLGSAAAKDSKR